MARDRLLQLKAVAFTTGTSQQSIAAQTHEDLDRMQGLVERMALVHTEILSSVDENSERLDPIVQEFQHTASEVLKLLQELRALVSGDDESARGRMNWTQYQALSQRFGDVTQDFNSEQLNYREKCKQRIRRQLEIMGSAPTDDTVEDMLMKGDVFVGQASQLEITKARTALDEVRARQKDIANLEESIREVAKLFTDVAALVEQQGEAVSRIEDNVTRATLLVNDGQSELAQAEENQRSARRKKIWCISYALLALLIIVVLIIISSHL